VGFAVSLIFHQEMPLLEVVGGVLGGKRKLVLGTDTCHYYVSFAPRSSKLGIEG